MGGSFRFEYVHEDVRGEGILLNAEKLRFAVVAERMLYRCGP